MRYLCDFWKNPGKFSTQRTPWTENRRRCLVRAVLSFPIKRIRTQAHLPGAQHHGAVGFHQEMKCNLEGLRSETWASSESSGRLVTWCRVSRLLCSVGGGQECALLTSSPRNAEPAGLGATFENPCFKGSQATCFLSGIMKCFCPASGFVIDTKYFE